MAELDPFEPDDESDDESDNERGGRPAHAAGAPDDDSDDDISDEPVECTISIAKPRKGALLFECHAWPTKLEVLKVSYIKDEKLVSEDTSEAERKLRAAGVGPEYDGLPKRIKEEFNKYLTERGIDGALAQSVSEFIKYKTQKEAQGWFDAVGSFFSGR
ncbi:hypothetical protein PILCRDRAFT_15375 [Piloderma croceum F 1598]|uniref:Mitochondrial glyco protein n=1 Tax=Piloderma croceum (strain F 1598) TaxID=765440 RepID=A0A0C3AHI8_PILCF|nr:hypothetical protein PILCRDRAFT_15375 [Piloderma croceum F 1598]